MSKPSILLIGGLVLAAAVYQILGRVPSEALNVALGVMCGIGASIPVSVGLLLALSRQRQRNQETEWVDPESEPVHYVPQPVQRIPQQAVPQFQPLQHALQQPQQPQIIVLSPQGQFPQNFPMPQQWANQPYPFMQEHANAVDAREWRIIGEE